MSLTFVLIYVMIRKKLLVIFYIYNFRKMQKEKRFATDQIWYSLEKLFHLAFTSLHICINKRRNVDKNEIFTFPDLFVSEKNYVLC